LSEVNNGRIERRRKGEYNNKKDTQIDKIHKPKPDVGETARGNEIVVQIHSRVPAPLKFSLGVTGVLSRLPTIYIDPVRWMS
jgi:hypothetical protein